MKKITASLLFVPIAAGACCLGACSHRQPKSSYRIIEEGDRNPYIINDPARAGTITRRADTPR